jgi:hypothetical protein
MKLLLWRRRRREDDLEEEIQSYLQMAIRDRMERGESAEKVESGSRSGRARSACRWRLARTPATSCDW